VYIEDRAVLFVEIPKTGSSTVRTMLEQTYGQLPLKGHIRENEGIGWVEDRRKPLDEVVAVWRDPVERWFSAFRQVYADEPGQLDEFVTHCMHTGRASQAVFKPQAWMLNGRGYRRRLFRFPPEAALRYVGVTGDIPHVNPGKTRWTLEDVSHRMDEIRDFVRDDLEFEQNAVFEEEKRPEEVSSVVKLTKSGKIDGRTKEGRKRGSA